MIYLFAKPIYIFVMALVLAILEVQIEGGKGWAVNLPTWRPKEHKWYSQFYKKVMSGKEMTGYHLSMFSFVFLIFHLPFFSGASWSFAEELKVWAIFFLFVVVWDYLWFVVNPFFTIKDFKGDHIFWHGKWIGNWPSDYWFSCFISLLLAIIVNFFFCPEYIIEWFIMFGVFIALTFITKILIKKFKPEWE
ncbi:hypothetical protein HOD96_00750 [Candidatus Falkowbacteria bacterium]|jgi:hypothetical protein|nr:hypothetical protein [Candidatus Falkowbacteria bacterium]MBT4433233.1 hypothetical protein [Candidatus Falkowbacteria bacterium]